MCARANTHARTHDAHDTQHTQHAHHQPRPGPHPPATGDPHKGGHPPPRHTRGTNAPDCASKLSGKGAIGPRYAFVLFIFESLPGFWGDLFACVCVWLYVVALLGGCGLFDSGLWRGCGGRVRGVCAYSGGVYRLVPVSLREANAFVVEHHRHNGSVRGWKFGVGLADGGGSLVGVAVAGRPVARGLDDGLTLEVTRVCTLGARNASSRLYGAIRRAAKALGYERLITYTLAEEPGTSLRAAGWSRVAELGGRSWDTPSRRRVDKHRIADRVRWEVVL